MAKPGFYRKHFGTLNRVAAGTEEVQLGSEVILSETRNMIFTRLLTELMGREGAEEAAAKALAPPFPNYSTRSILKFWEETHVLTYSQASSSAT